MARGNDCVRAVTASGQWPSARAKALLGLKEINNYILKLCPQAATRAQPMPPYAPARSAHHPVNEQSDVHPPPLGPYVRIGIHIIGKKKDTHWCLFYLGIVLLWNRTFRKAETTSGSKRMPDPVIMSLETSEVVFVLKSGAE